MDIRIKARAKINYFIEITGISGGYHDIDTVMGSIDLFDTVTVKTRKDALINVFCKGVTKEENTAYMAAKLFSDKFGTGGADIYINKEIPLCSGLGGSSADAAAVIFAYMTLYNIKQEQVRDICLKCGSDTLYMLKGGFARAVGRGEIITPFNSGHTYNIVVAKPQGGVDTKKAYDMYDKLQDNTFKVTKNSLKVITALKDQDYQSLNTYCYNSLLKASAVLLPRINDVLREIRECGSSAAFMSGSGSCCAGIFKNAQDAEKCADLLKNTGYFAKHIASAKNGMEII